MKDENIKNMSGATVRPVRNEFEKATDLKFIRAFPNNPLHPSNSVPLEYRNHPLVLNKFFYTIPEKLIRLVCSTPTGQAIELNDTPLEMELALSKINGDHTFHIGFWKEQPIECNLLDFKGKRDRALPMHPAFRAVVEGITSKHDGTVFRSQKGMKLRDREVLKTLQEQVIAPLCEEFPTPINEKGFANGTVHGFRHYFCSEAYRNGARDAELLEWLGHKNSQIMMLYRHLHPEDGQARMSQINFLDLDPKPDHRDNDVA